MLGAGDVEALADRPFNYADVGATAGELPGGFAHVRRSRVIGHGSAAFSDASAALLTWELHRRSGLSVAATSAQVTHGAEVLLGLGLGPVRLGVPCRVVYVVEETHRRGFAYGTLTGHPECGEELFVVTQEGGGAVTITITAFSRPALWWTRLAGPVGRRIQVAITARYLAALS